jgi:hypothetical protein
MPTWLEIVLKIALGLGAISLVWYADSSAREWPWWLRMLLWLPVTLASAMIGFIFIRTLVFLFVAVTAWPPTAEVGFWLDLIALVIGVYTSVASGIRIIGRSGAVAFLQAAAAGGFSFFVVEGAFEHPYAWLGATLFGFVGSGQLLTKDK